MRLGGLLLAAALLAQAPSGGAAAARACDYNPGVAWTALALGLHVMPCNRTDPTQQWAGGTLTGSGASALRSAGAPGYCLSGDVADPVTMAACTNTAPGTLFEYNHTARTLGVAGAGDRCLNVNHDTGPDINFERCPVSGVSPIRVQQRRQFDWLPATRQLRSVFETGLCLALNRSKILTYIEPPCVWPSVPPGGGAGVPWAGASSLLAGITVLENVTTIPGYAADTWYPAEDRHGRLWSGFDDGVVGAVTAGSSAPSFMTGTSVVTGAPHWRNLSADAVGGAIHEGGSPMNGRYTSANAAINGVCACAPTLSLSLSPVLESLLAARLAIPDRVVDLPSPCRDPYICSVALPRVRGRGCRRLCCWPCAGRAHC